MSDPTTALTITQKPPRRGGSGLGVFLLFILFLVLAAACAYRWLVVLPQDKIALIGAQQSQMELIDSRLRKLENAVPETQNAPAASAGTDDMTRMQTEVSSLSGAVASLQGNVKQLNDAQTANAGLIAAAIAYVRLDEAANSDHGFAPQLAAMRSATIGQQEIQVTLSSLDPYAASGAPTIPALQQEWASLSPQTAHIIDKANAQGWIERIEAELKSLISIHSVHDQQPDDIGAVSKALAQGNLTAADAAFQKLPAEAQSFADSFHKHLAARQAVDAALNDLANRFTATAPAAKP